ncbi:MAG: hypothetical protein M3R59_04515 [Verrucomicrobiota bacterium]|nr:hypothetical protein [Verrucomicrobiota bacterium]MDQ2949906.1 hypothetical protein [Acidobacteriota bacterium]
MMKLCIGMALGLLVLSSSIKPVPASRVQGTYVMRHANGQIEVWIIYPNFEFEQAFYETSSNFEQKKSYLQYRNHWSFEQSGYRTVLTFESSYSLIDYGTSKLLSTPEIGNAATADWIQIESKGKKSARLEFADDIGYVAVREGGDVHP